MTSLALSFLGGAPFQLLYDSVKTAIGRTRKFRTHLINLKSTLDCLQIIQQISDNNVQLSLPNDVTQDVLVKMEDGAALIDEVSSLSLCSIHVWGNCCNCIKPNYADQLDELDRSLRRLLELLKLEQMRNVTLLMLKLDEVQRGQSDILKALQENRGARVEQLVIQRIQENGQHTEGNGGGGGGGGAAPALGAVFGMLVDVVIQGKVKNLIFKRPLGELKSSLDYLKPLMEEIAKRNKVFHLPKHEVENFIAELEKGIELVHKCSKVRKWANYKKYEYTSKLLRLDEYLQRLFIELKGQLEMNVKKAIDSQTSIEAEIKKIEEGVVVQNSETESTGWSLVPKLLHSPPVGLDLQKTEVTKEKLVDSAGIIEEGFKLSEGSDVIQSQIQSEPPPPAVGLDARNVQEARDVIKETLVDSAEIIREGVKPSEGCDVMQNQIQSEPLPFAVGLDAMNVQEARDVIKETLASTRNIEVGVMGTEGRELVVDSTRNVEVTTDVKETLVDSAAIIEEGFKPSEGKELANKLILNPSVSSSSPDTKEFSMLEILSSYGEILVGCNVPQSVGGIAHLPDSLISDNASPCGDNDQQDLQDVSNKRKNLANWTEQVRESSEIGIERSPPDDGYSWRKYGQKDILGAKYPRGYYRCTHRNTHGCLATKQVQRKDEDQTTWEITYRGNHTCRHVGKFVLPSLPQQEEMNLVDNYLGMSFQECPWGALTFPPAGKSTQTEPRSAFDLTGKEPAKQLILNPSATSSLPDTREFLMQEKLPSYEEKLIAHVPESPFSVSDDQQDLQDVSKKRKTLTTWMEQVRVDGSKIGSGGPPDDGYSWRKYGKKEILGAKYPRHFYRCTHGNPQGCSARKHVQRMDEDPTILNITHCGNHTCHHVSKLVPPPSPQEQEGMNLLDNLWGTSSRALTLTSPPEGKSTQTEIRSTLDLACMDPVPDMDLPIEPFRDMDFPIDSFHDMELPTELGEVEDVVGFFS